MIAPTAQTPAPVQPRPAMSGATGAPVVVVCDAFGNDNNAMAAWRSGLPLTDDAFNLFTRMAMRNGFDRTHFLFIGLCPPMDEVTRSSAKRKWDHVVAHAEAVRTAVAEANPKLVVTMGELASRVMLGSAVKITKARGQVQEHGGHKIMPMLSPGYVLRSPEHESTFNSDFLTLGKLRDNAWTVEGMVKTATDYQWRADISDFLGAGKPKMIAIDTETTGLRHYMPEVFPFLVQFSPKPGLSLCVPIHERYWEKVFPNEPVSVMHEVTRQVQTLVEDREVGMMGHNPKFDHHMLVKAGMRPRKWVHDTQMLAFQANENMMQKNLDECVRAWVPEMAGYADCVVPTTQVLMADMSKVEARSLRVGDRLCAFTAETTGQKAQRRKMAISVVEGVQVLERDCLKITTKSGRTTTVSVGHLMLCKRGLGDKGGGWRWRRADSLTVGSVLKPFPWEDLEDSYGAGYVAGVIDGEGWQCTGNLRVGIAQKDNAVLRQFRTYMKAYDIEAGHSTDKRKSADVVNVTFDGHNAIRVLQKFQPRRLIEQEKWVGAGLPTDGHVHDPIVSIEPAGVQVVIGLKTSTQTIIADGLLSHNSFNSTIDKNDMINVEPQIMLPYAGGDPDAVFRLAKVLRAEVARDTRHYNCYRRIQMPALAMFREVTERYGVRIDQARLRSLGDELDEYIRDEYRSLIRQVPAAVRRKHMASQAAKGRAALENAISFTRDDFTRDILFTKEGFGLKPQVFTDSTRLLPPAQRVPSVSTKDHLPYFVTDPKAGDFILQLTEFVKAKKMASTYVGKDANDPSQKTGFWQYLSPNGEIHPSFALHKTNTGRTASSEPNGQNFPKRGRWAKPFLEVFIPRPGHKLAASDLSQIELRLAAWAAMEPTMLRVYRDGGDIHETTAAVASGIDEGVFKSWKTDDRLLIECGNEIPGSGAYLQSLSPGKRREAKVKDFYKLQRYRAKAVNFGFIYGAQASTFQTYAKTQYGVDYTLAEAEVIRTRYFQKYSKLLDWHDGIRDMVRKHGYVRAMHGAVRHLPAIWSKDRGIVMETERQAINAPIQRAGSDFCLIGAVRFQAQVDPEIARVILTIHDQVVLEVKDGHEEEMIKVLCWVMQNPPLMKWFNVEAPLPFGSDAEIGSENLGAMEERPDLAAEKPVWWNDDEDAVLAAFEAGDPNYSINASHPSQQILQLVA